MKKIVMITTVLFLASCVEPFEFEVRAAENVLVVEATITDQLERQKIFLKRASNLEDVNLPPENFNPNLPIRPVEDLTNYERGAVVNLIDDSGNRFEFFESEPGTYISARLFAAEHGREYQLDIQTTTNENIISEFKSIPGTSILKNLYSERIVNDFGVEGMAIYVDGEDSDDTTDYFRYIYEESYKIIAPTWTSREFNVIFEGNLTSETPIIEVVPRTQEERVCYNIENSSAIILENTLNLDASKVQRKLVRFIDRDNPILSHRYSIKVKQLLQSQESYRYYEILDNFTKSESLFSEIQPGFLEGNLKSSDEDTAVIGYFEVASVSEQRIFFDYDDYFEGEDSPPYFFNFNCDRLLSVPLIRLDGCPEPLPVQIRLELVEFVGFYDPINSPIESLLSACPGPYLLTPRICGDCTRLGSNVVPDFWVE
jgi:hypothetical protein